MSRIEKELPKWPSPAKLATLRIFLFISLISFMCFRILEFRYIRTYLTEALSIASLSERMGLSVGHSILYFSSSQETVN